MTTAAPVIVVGGGVAGLACAVRLTSRQIPVLLLEQRPHAGGRCRSFRDEVSGDVIDNGQHLLVAGYRKTLAFLDTIGTRDLISVQSKPQLLFHHPERGFHRLTIPRLPPPFHLLAGFSRFTLLSPADRLRLMRAGRALYSGLTGAVGLTVAEWFAATGQSAESRACLWDPLTIAIMNEVPERAAAEPFVRALKTAFLDSRNGAALAVPRCGLSELFVDPTLGYLQSHGGMVRCSSDVVHVNVEGGRCVGVRLRSGETITARAVVLAVPWYAADDLREVQSGPDARWREAEASVIVSVHLWYPEDFMGREPVGLIGRRSQWIFNRRAVMAGEGGHCAVVISAAREIAEWTNEQIIAQAAADIRSVYPGSPAPLRGLVIREKRATPSLTPELEPLRPQSVTRLPNLFLAGDWTATGFPATIEGAVQSGEDCAERITGQDGMWGVKQEDGLPSRDRGNPPVSPSINDSCRRPHHH